MTAECGQESPWQGDISHHAQGDLVTANGSPDYLKRAVEYCPNRVV